MTDTTNMNINFEKLRKRLMVKEFMSSLVYHTYVEYFGRARDATPEQLLDIARKYNINLDHYRLK